MILHAGQATREGRSSPPGRHDAMKAVADVSSMARDVVESWHFAKRGADLWAAQPFLQHWKGVPNFIRAASSLSTRPLR
eukprot:1700665-Rhodomonas_salina.3